MLNISEENLPEDTDLYNYGSFKKLEGTWMAKALSYWLVSFLFIVILFMFLPWTQNIQVDGLVTTLMPNQRPQTINSIISGRIERWYAREGQYVEKGDTLIFISEIKDEYFDPELMLRIGQQIDAKSGSIESYKDKINALNQQIAALTNSRGLKLNQSQNKIRQSELKVLSDSIDFEAAKTQFEIAEYQFSREEEMYKKGLKSLTELEGKRLKLQDSRAKILSAENKLLISRNELINANLEYASVRNDLNEKIAKANSDKFSAQTDLFGSDADLAKLRNKSKNVSVRQGYYYITAPQSGVISNAIQSGIGETIKEGEVVMRIVPDDQQLAVEVFVEPVDFPLIKLGEHMRFQFDGWPTIIFSGWPNLSYGTFGGTIVGVDKNISPNGKYRLLVSEDANDVPWPNALRVGSGAFGIVLLNDVQVWYELWRQLNGFPPDYYVGGKSLKKGYKLPYEKNSSNLSK